MSTAIELTGVGFRFGPAVAVDDVSLSIPRGEIFAFVGADGAGKTTLLRLMCAALPPQRGTLRVDGNDATTQAARIQASVGYMPARFSLYPDLSVAENLNFYGKLFGVPRQEFKRRSQTLLDNFALSPFTARLAGQLSGGMKQKLALACTLIHDPLTIILDEPTAGVDPLSRREFWRILYGINRTGTTIVVSTPYMDEAERAHRVAFVDQGRIVSVGSPAELKAHINGEVVEIACSDRRATRHALRGDPLVRSVEIYGDTLHILVASAAAAIPRLNERLEDAGVTDASLRVIPPSLEDAIVARMST